MLFTDRSRSRADRPRAAGPGPGPAPGPGPGPGPGPAAGGRVCRWAGALVLASAVILLPWTAYLAVTLPSAVTAQHWPLAWAGLDTAMAAGLAATGWLAVRRDRRVALVAVSTATVLVTDAWFDVCTSPAGQPLGFALADMGIELGEAAACLLLAWVVWGDAAGREGRRRRGYDDW